MRQTVQIEPADSLSPIESAVSSRRRDRYLPIGYRLRRLGRMPYRENSHRRSLILVRLDNGTEFPHKGKSRPPHVQRI